MYKDYCEELSGKSTEKLYQIINYTLISGEKLEEE